MEDAEFIANLWLSRPSFAELYNQLRPLIAGIEEVHVLFDMRTKSEQLKTLF